MPTQYQQTGLSFADIHEMSAFLDAQGFVHSSEGYTKVSELTGEVIDVSFTMTAGQVFLSMKPRKRLPVDRVGKFLGVYRGCDVYEKESENPCGLAILTAHFPRDGTSYQISKRCDYPNVKRDVDHYLAARQEI